ncbi:MAG TPA: phytanoyl-CoA dioxygenase family protein [Pseudomonadales bacterium]
MTDFAPPPKTELFVDIDDTQAKFFAENGYLALGRVTTDEELEWLRTVYDELLARPMSGFPDTYYDAVRPYGTRDTPILGQLLFPEQRVPAIKQTNLWRNARRIAQKLLKLPESEIEYWGHIVHKPARHGAATPWHQDEAYWPPEHKYYALGAWTPLDDVYVENGCMWFVPKSHVESILEHRHMNDDPAIAVLELVDEVDTSAAVPVPLPAGAISFHHPRTLHYAGPNTTGKARRAWANEYQSAPILLDVPAHRPWVVEGRKAMAKGMVPPNASTVGSV